VLGRPLVATGTIALHELMPWSKNFKAIESPITKSAQEDRIVDPDAQKKAPPLYLPTPLDLH